MESCTCVIFASGRRDDNIVFKRRRHLSRTRFSPEWKQQMMRHFLCPFSRSRSHAPSRSIDAATTIIGDASELIPTAAAGRSPSPERAGTAFYGLPADVT